MKVYAVLVEKVKYHHSQHTLLLCELNYKNGIFFNNLAAFKEVKGTSSTSLVAVSSDLLIVRMECNIVLYTYELFHILVHCYGNYAETNTPNRRHFRSTIRNISIFTTIFRDRITHSTNIT